MISGEAKNQLYEAIENVVTSSAYLTWDTFLAEVRSQFAEAVQREAEALVKQSREKP